MSNSEDTSSIREREKELARRLTVSPPTPAPAREVPSSKKESVPNKKYDELSVRLSYAVKVKFRRICSRLGRTPSHQAETLIQDFVMTNEHLLED